MTPFLILIELFVTVAPVSVAVIHLIRATVKITLHCKIIIMKYLSVYTLYVQAISLRKLAHAIYIDFFSPVKIENFMRKILIFFLFLL